MENKILILLLIVATVLTYGCQKNTEDSAFLTATVVDYYTKEPIAEAYVGLGKGYPNCHTNELGVCQIRDLSPGDYQVSASKKGFERYNNLSYFQTGESKMVIELHRLKSIPSSFLTEGEVKEVLEVSGSKSDNRYLVIRDGQGHDEYIFNEMGRNEGFEKFINKRVKITGFRDIGLIGWQRSSVSGIYVETIS